MKNLENAKGGDGRKTSPGLKKRPIELTLSGWANFGAGITNSRSDCFPPFFVVSYRHIAQQQLLSLQKNKFPKNIYVSFPPTPQVSTFASQKKANHTSVLRSKSPVHLT